MSVRIESNQRRYVGLSSDIKPVDGVSPGSTFFETDSKCLFMYDGQLWVRKENVSNTDSLLMEILDELREQKDLIAVLVSQL